MSKSTTPDYTYDEAIRRAETIVQSLERSEALSIAEYKQKAKEAKDLLDFCEKQLKGMEKDLLV